MINFTTGLARSKAKYAQASATIHKLPPINTHHCVIYNRIPTLVFSLLWNVQYTQLLHGRGDHGQKNMLSPVDLAN